MTTKKPLQQTAAWKAGTAEVHAREVLRRVFGNKGIYVGLSYKQRVEIASRAVEVFTKAQAKRRKFAVMLTPERRGLVTVMVMRMWPLGQ